MPDKVTPSQFAASLKGKYPQYKDIDDSSLVDLVVKKYPQYKEIIDFGAPAQGPITPIQPQQAAPSKYTKAVVDDRSEIGKTLSSLYNGLVGIIEEVGGSIIDLPAQFAITAPSFTPIDIGGVEKSVREFRDLPIEKRLEPAKETKKALAKKVDVLRSGYTTRGEEKAIQSKFDVTNGIGLDDIQGLVAMSGNVLSTMALGTATGGVTYLMQGYNNAVNDYDESVEKFGLKPDANARGLYGVAGGVINGLLEKFAVDKIVGDVPVFRDIQRKAIANVLKRTASQTGTKAIKSIEAAAEAEIKKLTSDLKSKGVRAAYRAMVEGGTEAAQAALEDGAKFAANAVQGEQAFNEQEIKRDFFKNVLNSAVAGGVFGPAFGAGADVAFGRNVNTQLLKDIANARTDEDIRAINDELSTTFDENNFSQEERDIILNNAKRYAEVKQTLPPTTPSLVQEIVIPKIEERIKLDNEINSRKQSIENIDEAIRPSEEDSIRILEDKRSAINDDIRELVSGDRFNYFEQDGKFFKQLGENAPEEISRNRFELQQLKTEQDATKVGQEPIQEGRPEGDITERQVTEEGKPVEVTAEEATTKADTGYRYIVSEEGSEAPVASLVNKKVRINGEPAILYQEGQRIVARVLGTNRILDTFGSVDEMMNATPDQFGIEVDDTIVTETPTGYRVEGEEMVNSNENPLDAISIDSNGNVMNVVLTTPAGKRRKFRGQAAQDLAYQIQLKQILQNEEEFERFLESEHQSELDAAAAEAETRAVQESEQAPPTPVAEPVPAGPTITTEPTIGRFTADNVDEVSSIKVSGVKRKVLNDVKRVVNAIKSIVPAITGNKLSVNIHDKDSYGKAVIEAGGTEQEAASRAFYMASDGSIHINLDNVKSDTMLHEGFHPILDLLENENPEQINEFFSQLEQIPEAAAIISQARETYEGDITQKKEAITDFVAGVADGRIVLNPTNTQKIKAFILNTLNKLGIGQGQVLMNVQTKGDLIKLANFVTEKFIKGENITQEALGLIVGDKQYDSSNGLDIDENLPTEGSGRGPQFSKETLAAARENLKRPEDLAGTKISRVVFYDLTRVGKLSIKNIKTGYTPDIDGKGGPLYSYMPSSIRNKAVLAFVSINQAIQSLQRQILYPNGVHAIASQNPQTAHLGNKSTLSALFGDGIGIFQNAVKNKSQESEIVNVLVGEIDRISKMPKGEASKAVNKILKTVDLKSIKTINDFRDKILLGAGDSFGSRGAIFAQLFQSKQTKITAATRNSHKVLHYKYGIPTIADIAEGNNQVELAAAELGDVIKLVKPSTDPVIYTTSKEQFDKYSSKPTPEMKKAGIRIELIPEDSSHESYPFVLAGENVALLDNFISATQMYNKFENLPKAKSFFSVGRMKKLAEAGEIPKAVTKEVGAPAFQKAPTKPLGKKRFGVVQKIFKEQIRFGLLGKGELILREKMGELSAEMDRAERFIKAATDKIKQYGAGISSTDISDFLTGKNTSPNLPQDVIDAITEMRNHIDVLTERLIQLGVIDTQESIDYYRANKGSYLLRSYESINYKDKGVAKLLYGEGLNIDNVVKKLKNVDKTVVDAALKHLADRARAAHVVKTALEDGTIKVIDLDNDNYRVVLSSNNRVIADFSKDPKKTKTKTAILFMSEYLIDRLNIQDYNEIKSTVPKAKLSDEDATKDAFLYANLILSDSEQYIMNKGLTGSTNIASLLKRKEIAPEIRALMGEYTDPLYNYYSSIFKISSLTSSRQYLNSLKDYGMNKFLFTSPTEDATIKIAGDESRTLEPLNGLYTFPEIAEALKKKEKETTNLISQIAGRVRMFKTVYNPATHVKNIIGNMGFAVSNGHWNYIPEAYKYLKAEIAGGNDKQVMDVMYTLNKYGVLNNAIGIGELKQYFNKHDSVDDFLKNIYNNANAKASKLSKTVSSLQNIPSAIQKAYAIEDDFFKILGFVNESNRYAKAYYKKPYNQLKQNQKDTVNERVTEIVKDTYPTFSRVPKIVKTISKYMFMGNFLAFPVESVRVSYNTLKLAVSEINSGNEALVNVGRTRILGTLAYNSLFSTLTYYAFNLAGAGLTGALGYFAGDDEEENEVAQGIRKFVAPWNKKNDIYVSQFSNGKLIYYDIGSLDSYGYQKRVWNAFWENMNNEEGFYKAISESIGEALDPWLQKDFVVENYMALVNGKDRNGRPIYNPEDKAINRYKKQAEFVGKQFGPGIVGASIKIVNSYQDKDYDKMKDEFYSQIFARKYTVDLKKQYINYMYADEANPEVETGFKNRLANARNIYNEAKRSGLKGRELDARYIDAVNAYKNVLKTANEYYNAAMKGGVSAQELSIPLRKARLGRAETSGVKNNNFNFPNSAYISK